MIKTKLNFFYSSFLKQAVKFLFVLLLIFNLSFPLYGATLSDKEAELEDLKSELQGEKEKYLEANEKETELSEELRENQKLLCEAQGKVKEVAVILNTTTEELKLMKTELASKEAVYEEHQEELGSRLQNIYENLDPSCLAVLTESKTFSEFINSLYYLQMLVEDDFKLLKSLQREKIDIAKKKVAVEKRYNQVLELKKQLNEKEAHLLEIAEEKEYLLSLVKSERESCSNRIVQLEHNTQEIENQIFNIINGVSADESYPPACPSYDGNGSLSCWPSSGSITSSFGWRCHPIYGDWRFHSGIDIGADYGEPIAAAGDGVVITSDWLGGYGYTVMIDHGGGMVSLYAHCSSLLVNYGESVKEGQTVAIIGSTGASTGPHLHFEVRQNGVSVDPSAFF